MRFLGVWVGLFVLPAGLPAAPIDVSSETTQVLQSGDSLVFLFADSSYAQYAAALGMPASPSQIFFNFFSAPVGSAGQFTAGVESLDGSASAQFPGSMLWSPGMVQMSGYSGPASVVSGGLTLADTLSSQIFAGPEAELTLTYTGPDVTVGLDGSTLKHDVTISLAGGPLSIGALDYSVALVGAANSAVVAPEPGSGALIVLTGVLLCAISAAVKRFARSR